MSVHVTTQATVESQTGAIFLPRIGYENLARGAALAASSAAAGFPAKAAQNDNTFEFWKPTAVPATWRADLGSAKTINYAGIAAHDIGTAGASVQIQYSTDDSIWNNASDDTDPSDDGEMLFLFPQQTARYWRVRATLAIPTIGHIRFGGILVMAQGIASQHSPLNLSKQVESRPSMAERGQWLGASVIRSGLEGAAQWQNLTASWYRTNFHPFVLEARSRARPFFFAWNPSGAAQDVAYCALSDDVEPTFRPADVVDVRIRMKGADRV